VPRGDKNGEKKVKSKKEGPFSEGGGRKISWYFIRNSKGRGAVIKRKRGPRVRREKVERGKSKLGRNSGRKRGEGFPEKLHRPTEKDERGLMRVLDLVDMTVLYERIVLGEGLRDCVPTHRGLEEGRGITVLGGDLNPFLWESDRRRHCCNRG